MKTCGSREYRCDCGALFSRYQNQNTSLLLFIFIFIFSIVMSLIVMRIMLLKEG